MIIFLYNLYIFVWIQHACLVKIFFALDPICLGIVLEIVVYYHEFSYVQDCKTMRHEE